MSKKAAGYAMLIAGLLFLYAGACISHAQENQYGEGASSRDDSDTLDVFQTKQQTNEEVVPYFIEGKVDLCSRCLQPSTIEIIKITDFDYVGYRIFQAQCSMCGKRTRCGYSQQEAVDNWNEDN